MRSVQVASQTPASGALGRELSRWVFAFAIVFAADITFALLAWSFPGPAGFDPASLVGP